MNRTRPPFALLFAIALLAVLPTGALANGVGVLARNGDKLTTGISPAGDDDAFAVELAEGGKLSLVPKAAKGEALIPVIRVFGPDGDEIDVTALIKKPGN